jgi:hypothetical protein
MPLEMIFKSIHLRPRILHRLPGRLRIHIPVLRQISEPFQKFVHLLLQDFTLPEGIRSVRINFITGNLLIEYDIKGTEEKEILRWLEDIAKIAEGAWSKFSRVKNGNKDQISENLIEYLTQKANTKVKLDKNFHIPEYVWN